MTSFKEIETKIAIQEVEAITARLQELFIPLIQKRYFEDNWCFDFSDKKLAKADILLRLRDANGIFVLTVKGPASKTSGMKFRDEWELTISDKNNLLKILKILGLKVLFRYQKYRTVYEYHSSLICLDETPIGSFLELEGNENSIFYIANLLGFSPQNFIPDSYASLFKSYKSRNKMKCKNMIFQKT